MVNYEVPMRQLDEICSVPTDAFKNTVIHTYVYHNIKLVKETTPVYFKK